MRHRLLLPNRYKFIGLFALIPFLALGIAVRFFDFGFTFLTRKSIWNLSAGRHTSNITDYQNNSDELALSGIIISLLLIAFSREKQEDEFISQLRLESLQWAVLINYLLLLAATWIVYQFAYLDVMMYNMLTVLLLFILRFHILLWKNKYSTDHQKS
jgi:hypothetical protein